MNFSWVTNIVRARMPEDRSRRDSRNPLSRLFARLRDLYDSSQ